MRSPRCRGAESPRARRGRRHAGPSDRGVAPVNRELAVAEPLGGGRPARSATAQHLVEQPRRRARRASRVSSRTPLTSRSMLSAIGSRRPRVAGDLDHRRDRIAGRRAEAGREHARPARRRRPCRSPIRRRAPACPSRSGPCRVIGAGVGDDVVERRRARRPCASRRATSLRSSSGRRGCCPGDGCVPRMSRPSAIASVSTRLITRSSRAAVVGARRARRQQVLGAHDFGDLAEHRRAAEIDQPIGDAAERRIRRQARGVVGAAALDRQDQPTTSHHSRGGFASSAASVARDLDRRARSRGRCRPRSGSRRSAPACRRAARRRRATARRPARSRARRRAPRRRSDAAQ